MKCAHDNNFSIIRIKQEDVYRNKFDWKKVLCENIKSYDKITNIFIAQDDSYENYIKNFDNTIHIKP